MHAVMYVDGSSKPNPGPGFGGYGIHGYLCEETTKKINPRHTIHNKLFYTLEGYSLEKPSVFIDVKTIVEAAVAINGISESNNLSELLAVKWVLDNYLTKEEITKVTIITDSNYVVNCYKDMLAGWAANGWKRTDGNPIAYKSTWEEVERVSTEATAKGKIVDLVWVKGHSDDYGNEMADLYAAIGSLASKHQQASKALPEAFKELIFHKQFNLKEYKETFKFKDVMFSFKQLFFSNSKDDDSLYCFLFNPPKKESHSGKRTLESVFAINTGYVPKLINEIKDYHRSLPRQCFGSACLNINTLSTNHKLRLFSWTPIEYLLTSSGNDNDVYIVQEVMPIMCDVGNKLPLLHNLNKMYDTMTEISDISEELPNCGYHTTTLDITDMIVVDKKIAFSNQVKSIDVTDRIQDEALRNRLVTRLVLAIGSDILNYLAMKQVEELIESVVVKLGFNMDTNGVTCLVNFNLGNRSLVVSNISNKFLARR